MNLILIFTAFTVKHFICDFPLQKPFHYLNKGKYGHHGGIQHALIHTGATGLILGFFVNDFYTYAVIDGLIHYHMDWFKTWLCAKKNYKPDNSAAYWIWLGIDQMVHYLTYIGIIWMVTNGN